MLRVYVSVPEVDADAIHNGDNATLTQDSNPDLKIPGTIVRVKGGAKPDHWGGAKVSQ
jgi:hypothetical protein